MTSLKLPAQRGYYCYDKDGKRTDKCLCVHGVIVSNDVSVLDAKYLELFPNLKVINLAYTDITDFSPLSEIGVAKVTLESLDLTSTQIDNIEVLSEFTSLKHLYLANTRVSDISPIANCKELLDLNLINTPVSDITPLKGIALATLFLVETNVTDITPLEHTTSLQCLHLPNGVDSLSVLYHHHHTFLLLPDRVEHGLKIVQSVESVVTGPLFELKIRDGDDEEGNPLYVWKRVENLQDNTYSGDIFLDKVGEIPDVYLDF